MTRAEGVTLLLTRGWDAMELARMSDALVDWIATDAPYWRNGIRSVGPKSAAKETPLTPEAHAELVEEGRAIAQRDGMRDATMAALATIARVGRGCPTP